MENQHESEETTTVAEATSALEAATQSLKSLTRIDIAEVKCTTGPPVGMKLVMAACCIMLQVPPVKVVGADGHHTQDYWKASRHMLAEPTFLERLVFYDREGMEDAVMHKLDPYLQNPDFSPERLSRVSKACSSICLWVMCHSPSTLQPFSPQPSTLIPDKVCAMHKYYHATRTVHP
jgi:dynein heavy chain